MVKGFQTLRTIASLVVLSTFSVAGDTNVWLKEQLLDADSKLPMSFVYGTESWEVLIKTWTRKIESKPLDAFRTEHSIIWTDPCPPGPHRNHRICQLAGNRVGRLFHQWQEVGLSHP
jgi:hypothetical protein